MFYRIKTSFEKGVHIHRGASCCAGPHAVKVLRIIMITVNFCKKLVIPQRNLGSPPIDSLWHLFEVILGISTYTHLVEP